MKYLLKNLNSLCIILITCGVTVPLEASEPVGKFNIKYDPINNGLNFDIAISNQMVIGVGTMTRSGSYSKLNLTELSLYNYYKKDAHNGLYTKITTSYGYRLINGSTYDDGTYDISSIGVYWGYQNYSKIE